jgi:hypothetical protein
VGEVRKGAPRRADERAARRLVLKLRTFMANELDADERALFGALIIPGLSQALLDGDDVQGFAMTSWTPRDLPDALVIALQESSLRLLDVGE